MINNRATLENSSTNLKLLKSLPKKLNDIPSRINNKNDGIPNLSENLTAKSANNSTMATIKIYINPPWGN